MANPLGARLAAVASCVRDGAFLADVGTDHAYLPIALMQAGRIRGAVASDVHKGPLLRAEQNIREAGLSAAIETRLADGLAGLFDLPLTDIVIAGMGGGLIAEILQASPSVREKRPYLILQPMQNISELRVFLSRGYAVVREEQASEDGKFYQILCAEYDGVVRHVSPLEAELGAYNIEHKRERREAFRALAERRLAVLEEKIRGLLRGAHDASAECALRDAIRAELCEIGFDEPTP